MTSHQQFKDQFLSALAKFQPGTILHYRLPVLEQEYAVPSPHCEELLLQWASDSLIDIHAYSGQGVLRWNLWPSQNDLFYNTTDGGYVRITLLAAGAEYVALLRKRGIGFFAGA
jgi:hypothetical protein